MEASILTTLAIDRETAEDAAHQWGGPWRVQPGAAQSMCGHWLHDPLAIVSGVDLSHIAYADALGQALARIHRSHRSTPAPRARTASADLLVS